MSDETEQFVFRTRRLGALRVGGGGLIVLLVSLYFLGSPATWLKTDYTYTTTDGDGQEVEMVEEGELDTRVVSLSGLVVGVSLVLYGLVMFARSKRAVVYAEDDSDLDDALAESVAKMMPDDAPKRELVDKEVLRKGLRRVGLRTPVKKKQKRRRNS